MTFSAKAPEFGGGAAVHALKLSAKDLNRFIAQAESDFFDGFGGFRQPLPGVAHPEFAAKSHKRDFGLGLEEKLQVTGAQAHFFREPRKACFAAGVVSQLLDRLG